MSLDNFISELHSMGFSEEVITEVIQSLADLYIASKIPYAFVDKSSWPYTPENIKRTKYWTYSEITEKILKQHKFIDSSSAYTIYSKYTNWYFIALTEKGLPIAKEAYENRLQNNLSFINELIKKYKYLLPILYYGASYDSTLKRFYFFHNYKINIIEERVPDPRSKKRFLPKIDNKAAPLSSLRNSDEEWSELVSKILGGLRHHE